MFPELLRTEPAARASRQQQRARRRCRGDLIVLLVTIVFAALLAQHCRAAPASPGGNLKAAPTPDTHSLSQSDLGVWLDGFMPYALHEANVAGAVVVVVKDGQVLFQGGYGYADVASQRPVDPDTTLFRPGSISKLFTFTAVMQLVERGKIDLDADINTYLDFRIPPFRGQPITMRNLMTHTPGFEDAYRDLYADPAQSPPSLERFVKQQVPARVYPPGRITAYSNYGVTLAGYIVQRICGKDFNDYIEQNIFEPLGMRNATFRQPLPKTLKSQMSSGYDLASGPAKPYEIIGVAPAGSMAVTGADMAKFMIAHLQDGEFQGRRILQPATAQMMHNTPMTVISPSLHRFLLGFYERDRNGHRIIAHDGDSQWFHSNLLLYLDDGVGLFVSMNSRGQGGGSSLIREALYQGFTDRYFPEPTPAPLAEMSTASRDAKLLTGDYLSSRRELTTFWSLLNLTHRVSVSVRDDGHGHLVIPQVTGLNGQPEHFTEVAPFVWREIGGKNRLAARMSAGKVVMWSDDQDSNGVVFLPASPLENGTWVLPLLGGSVVILWGLGLAGIARALIPQWRPVDASAGSGRWGALVSVSVLASGLLMAVWWATVIYMSQAKVWTSSVLPWIGILQSLSLIVFPLAAVAAAWSCRKAFSAPRGRRSALTALGRVLALGAALVLFWASLAFHLISFRRAF